MKRSKSEWTLAAICLLIARTALPGVAQDEAADAEPANPLVGTWEGLKLDDRPLEEGEFLLTFNADGSGSLIEGPGDSEDFEYTYDAENQRCVLYIGGDKEDAFPIDVSIDGDTATFTPTQDDDELIARRVPEEGEAAGDADADADDEAPADQAAEGEDAILGRWYVQIITDGDHEEVIPVEMELYIVFEGDGEGYVVEEDGDEEPFIYDHNPEQTTIEIFDEDKDPEVMLTYAIEDGVLVFEAREPGGDDEMRMELTRNAEGTERHQELREESGDQPNRAQTIESMSQMRAAVMAGTAYATENRDKFPGSLGALVVSEYITPDMVLAPWSEHEVPNDFGRWDEGRQSDWVNAHADYAFVEPGMSLNDADGETIVLVELPLSLEVQTVSLVFSDGHAEMVEVEEADERVREQTGHGIDEWMRTESPGTGQMILPDEHAAEAHEHAHE